jgi:hypothetical protein
VKRLAALALLAPTLTFGQAQTHELAGLIGSRPAFLVLHASREAEGAWQLAGEYVVLPTLQRRFLEGEASPEIGVTTLREGTTPILFGRPSSGELRGTWRAGTFRGARYAPGGQERERFEFSEEFPPLDNYSASIDCEAAVGRYWSALSLAVETGKLQAIAWRSRVAPSGQACSVTNLQQQPFTGGLRFAGGRCNVTLREVGEYVLLDAQSCAEQCGSQAYLEPVVIDRRGRCQLLRPEAR